MLKATQEFTYWKKSGVDIHGQPGWDGPHYFRGRFEVTQTVFLNVDGRETRGDATIYSEKTNAQLGDVVFVGRSSSETPENTAREIRSYRAIPNLRGTRTEYRLIL